MPVDMTRPAEVIYPDPKGEERILIPMPEFGELKQWLDEMTDPVVHASNFATTFLGVAIGSFIAWLQMKHHQTSSNTVFVITVASLILFGFMVWVSRENRKEHGSDKKRLGRMMERLESTCPRLTTSGEFRDPSNEGGS
jgi:hypothetical protein